MLNKKRTILIVNSEMEKQVKDLFRFEAIEVISKEEEIKTTWSYNKTPLMLKKYADDKIINEYPTLTVDVDLYNFEPGIFIEVCHENGIESGEYITGEKFDTLKEGCFLCDIANHRGMGSTLYFNANVEEIHDIIIYEADNFYVKIEYGCMKKGMLMICPKFHVLSVANIPDEYMNEYLQIMKDVEYLLKEIYGDAPVIFFEHGSASNGMASHKSSIVHAHTHVAWGLRFEKKYLDMVCLKPAKDIRNFKDLKYMSYQEGTNGQLFVVANPKVYVQRQYPRQVIGEMLGIEPEKTNWRKEPFMDNINETFEDFYKFLTAKEDIPDRIFQATKSFVKGYERRKN